MGILIYRTTYDVTGIGYNDLVSDTITINGVGNNTQSGTIHTTSVIHFERITLYQKWLSGILESVDSTDLSDRDRPVDDSDILVMQVFMKDDSLLVSVIVGIDKTNHQIKYNTYKTVFLTYNYLDENTLKIGDKIISINGSTDLSDALENTTCGDKATFVILRGDEELEFEINKKQVEDKCLFGMYLSNYSEIESTEVDYTIHKASSTGNSGGLLQTLYVYNQLTETDYTFGLKIAGTGTMDELGNVGYVGGIKQKILTSVKNGVDVFFVPHLTDLDIDNYIQALEIFNTLDTDMKLVGVKTFDDVLTYLESVGE